jgi:hypothetical protein
MRLVLVYIIHMKVAFIITGDVRNCKTRNTLPTKLTRSDVFCGSYQEHVNYLSKFGNNNAIIRKSDIRPPYGLHRDDMQQNMLQWLCLDEVIKRYKNQLLTYDVICKIRFDTIIHGWDDYHKFVSSKDIRDGVLYNDSDRVFYGRSGVFINAFEDFYDHTIRTTFIPHKHHNFRNSWKSEPEFRNMLSKKKIHNKRITQKISIDRGSYRKRTADGNEKLYTKSGMLLGKFTL